MAMNALVGSLLATMLLHPVPQDPGKPATTPEPRVEWQRSLADALAVQKATGLPLLLVVNMNGEVFNDRFATTTYHDPAFVELTRGYVCVVASPDRHTERDYDALGNRVECPRFPGCTCSEHINIEPELFTRFFDGKRNAPRHVGVSPDGKVLFDRFLDASMQTAIDAIEKHRGKPKDTSLRETTDVGALLRRRDAQARRTIERLYRDGSLDQKRKLLEAAATATNEPFDLLRMAQRDDDPTVFGPAGMALAKVTTKDALTDLEDALARANDPVVAQALVARLQELGKSDKPAARLHAHFVAVDDARLPVPWRNEWNPPAFDPASRESIEAVLDACESKLRTAPGDDEARLALATAQAGLASLLAATGGKGAELWFEDAQRSAAKITATPLQAEAKAVVASTAWLRGDQAAAHAAAVQALTTVNSLRKPDAWLAATFLDVVVQTTASIAYGKAKADEFASLRTEIDRTDLVLRLLTERAAGAESTFLVGIGLFEHAGLRLQARQRLESILARFPASAAVHERWRNRMLIDLGAETMRKRYTTYVERAADRATAEWFAGYASLVAGEQHTRDERREVAMLAYTDAIERFAKSTAGNAEFTDSANHFAVLSLAGRAVIRQALGDGEGAVADMLRAAELRPSSLDETDGLQRKPRAIAGRISRELAQQGKLELAEKLKPIMP